MRLSLGSTSLQPDIIQRQKRIMKLSKIALSEEIESGQPDITCHSIVKNTADGHIIWYTSKPLADIPETHSGYIKSDQRCKVDRCSKE